MYVQLSCVIADANATNRQELSTFLASLGVHTAGQFGTNEQLGNVLSRPDAPHLAIINLDPNPGESLKKIAGLPRQYPNIAFFLMSMTLDPNLLMEAMHLGIKEFIPLPISEQKFASAIERLAQVHGMGKRARIIQVIPSVGGCGSTTLSCNVAAALAVKSKTVLMDMDLMRGTVASCFDSRPRFTLADVMDAAEKADKQLLDNALAIHKKSGLALLARPELPEDTQRVNTAGLSRLINLLSHIYDNIIIDSLMSISPMYGTLIQGSDINVIVMQLNIPSAKNTERFVGALRRMGIESSKIRIVVNRYVKKGNDIEPEEVERALGLKISWAIPNDFKNAIGAINLGEPVVLRAPRSEMATSLVGLAQSLLPKPAQSNIAA